MCVTPLNVYTNDGAGSIPVMGRTLEARKWLGYIELLHILEIIGS